MKIIARYLGGSNSYGLATPTSDKDDRFLFLHTERSKIIGLERYEHQSKQTDGEDCFGWELRHFLNMLKKGNTMCLEMINNDNWIEITPEFKYLQGFKHQLIDSHKLYKCLKGYVQSERGLVLGKRVGVLGGKRKETLEKLGYSYKNLVQFLRLCLAGTIFFQEGVFPVNIRQFDKADLLFTIKTKPKNFNKELAIQFMDDWEKLLDNAYNSIKVIYKYDDKLANDICFHLYMPILTKTS